MTEQSKNILDPVFHIVADRGPAIGRNDPGSATMETIVVACARNIVALLQYSLLLCISQHNQPHLLPIWASAEYHTLLIFFYREIKIQFGMNMLVQRTSCINILAPHIYLKLTNINGTNQLSIYESCYL